MTFYIMKKTQDTRGGHGDTNEYEYKYTVGKRDE